MNAPTPQSQATGVELYRNLFFPVFAVVVIRFSGWVQPILPHFLKPKTPLIGLKKAAVL